MPGDPTDAALVQGCDPQILTKAINYLYTKETRETFALEGEVASGSKAERFIDALRSVRDFDPASEDQTRLQNVVTSTPRRKPNTCTTA